MPPHLAQTPYRALASVRMNGAVYKDSETCLTTTRDKMTRDTTLATVSYTGHLDWTGIHGVWTRIDYQESGGLSAQPNVGTWSLAPVKCLPWDALKGTRENFTEEGVL